MPDATYSGEPWRAPAATGRLDARIKLPGSKSQTNRELVLSALAKQPSVLRRPLIARDTELMVGALTALGARIERSGDDLHVTPGPPTAAARIDCGLAGTVMRFVPPVAALADGPVAFDGDERARSRPMGTLILALRALGVAVDDDGRGGLPFTVRGSGAVEGGRLIVDASASSQFVSALLLAAPRFVEGLDLEHRGERLPSLPHIAMTIDALGQRGVEVVQTLESPAAYWTVPHHAIRGRDVTIEPDLSNAAPFLAAALVAGGRVAVAGWPHETTQVGDRLRDWLKAFGADVDVRDGDLVVEGGDGAVDAPLKAVGLDLSEGGELAPTLIGLAAFADGPSSFTGIGHLRGHETDRLAALVTELRALGAGARETEDGLVVEPARLSASGRPWHAYADHRMATTGALLGLAVPGTTVDDVATTAKTLPGFTLLWERMLA